MKNALKRKRIAVIGLGQFGDRLARDLARHCDVLAIDKNSDRVDAIADHVQRALCLDAGEYNDLKSVITPDFDEAIISLSKKMESSILCTLHLSRIGIKSIRAKAVNDDHASILKHVGATSIIFPERETADRMAARIANNNLIDFVPLEQDYRVVDVASPTSFYGHSLMDLQLRKRFGVYVIAVRRNIGKVFLFMPGPDYVVQDGDVLVMIGREQDFLNIA